MKGMFEQECQRAGEKEKPLQDVFVRMENETMEERCIVLEQL